MSRGKSSRLALFNWWFCFKKHLLKNCDATFRKSSKKTRHYGCKGWQQTPTLHPISIGPTFSEMLTFRTRGGGSATPWKCFAFFLSYFLLPYLKIEKFGKFLCWLYLPSTKSLLNNSDWINKTMSNWLCQLILNY